ncbi:MAG: tRNA (cytidine(34)-2'-O)-methyltransferase [Desulfococcaceae bacterium]
MNEEKIERHVVLVCPEVHWNTGNAGRTCLGTGSFLHLIRPLGFSLSDKHVRRAGLDYWSKVKFSVWDNFDVFRAEMKCRKEEVFLFSKKGAKSFWSASWSQRSFLVFGSETKGLPEELLSMYKDNVWHIPVLQEIRSLNLSTSVGIALYESLRFSAFPHGWE